MATGTRPPFAGLSVEEVFARIGSGDPDVPSWPPEADQRRFTGGSGLALLRRAAGLVDMLDRDGAFADPDWKGLDYGCGWGRIATYMLTRGTPEQLDMCDAWEGSLDLARKGRFSNHMFKVSDCLQPGEIAADRYDFIYALSIFTHLNREAVDTNIPRLCEGLKPGGSLYFTVRGLGFLEKAIASGMAPEGSRLDETGFWHITYPKRQAYGETVISEAYLHRLAAPLGEIAYLGIPEYEQQLYRIRKPS
jgi:trans-aconitate methyltransferase